VVCRSCGRQSGVSMYRDAIDAWKEAVCERGSESGDGKDAEGEPEQPD